VDCDTWVEVIDCPVRLLLVNLTRLENLRSLGDLHSLEEKRSVVLSIIGEMHLSDVHSVVSEVVVNDVGFSNARYVESEHFSVIVKELLLRSNFSSSQFVLKEVHHLLVLHADSRSETLSETILSDVDGARELVLHS
jgi:hypothetical protein